MPLAGLSLKTWRGQEKRSRLGGPTYADHAPAAREPWIRELHETVHQRFLGMLWPIPAMRRHGDWLGVRPEAPSPAHCAA